MAQYPLFFVSGRNVEAYTETAEWLKRFEIPVSGLRLRGESDPLHNGEYKVAHIHHLRNIGYEPILMLEDHVSVSKLIQEKTGVKVLTVKPWYEDTVGVNMNNVRENELLGAKK